MSLLIIHDGWVSRNSHCCGCSWYQLSRKRGKLKMEFLSQHCNLTSDLEKKKCQLQICLNPIPKSRSQVHYLKLQLTTVIGSDAQEMEEMARLWIMHVVSAVNDSQWKRLLEPNGSWALTFTCTSCHVFFTPQSVEAKPMDKKWRVKCNSKGDQSAFFLLMFQQVALYVPQRPLVSCMTGRSQSIVKSHLCIWLYNFLSWRKCQADNTDHYNIHSDAGTGRAELWL